jgi:hypothetical protein
MAVNDLAGFELVGTYTPELIFAGDEPPKTDAAPSLVASIAKYQVVALVATGVTTFVVGTHTAAQAVIAAQPVTAIGQACPYFNAGKFNHAALVWPADASIDTYAERKAFFAGTTIKIGRIA